MSEAKPLKHINPAPQYPSMARRRGWEGTVLLRVFVNDLGKVDEITINQSSGHSTLDRAAIKTVMKWQFEPAAKNDKNISSTIIIPIEFKLK